MKRESLKKNIIANYVGRFWSAIMGLAFIPLYISQLGVESYGVIGLFAIIYAWLALLDMGLGVALTREMARYLGGQHDATSIRSLLFSVLCIYVIIAAIATTFTMFFASWLANDWLQVERIGVDSVENAISLMAIVIGLRMIEGLLGGAIKGLQKQVWFNCWLIVLSTLRWGGAALVLYAIEPSLDIFFYWQAFISLLTVVIYANGVFSWIPNPETKISFSFGPLKKIWKFSSWIFLSAILATILTHLDKVIITKRLTFEVFAIYTLAATVSGALYQIINPLVGAIYPRLTQLVAAGSDEEVIKLYHSACQGMSVLMIPPAFILVFFTEPIVFLWLGDTDVAARVAPIAIWLVLGTLFNGFQHIPTSLALAHGWGFFPVIINVFSLLIILPYLLFMIPEYGATGAASAWFVVNFGYILFSTPILHYKLIPTENWKWYLYDVGLPLFGALTCIYGLSFIVNFDAKPTLMIAQVMLSTGLLYLITILCAPDLKKILFKKIKGSNDE